MSDFEDVHDRFLRAWATGLSAGQTDEIEEFMATDYHGWFAPTATQQHPYDRTGAVDGMRGSVASLRGAQFVADHRTISLRSEDEAVVCYEKRIERSGRLHSSALIVESWRHDGARWWLHRELTEYGAQVPAVDA
jgi:hypothetical protein